MNTKELFIALWILITLFLWFNAINKGESFLKYQKEEAKQLNEVLKDTNPYEYQNQYDEY